MINRYFSQQNSRGVKLRPLVISARYAECAKGRPPGNFSDTWTPDGGCIARVVEVGEGVPGVSVNDWVLDPGFSYCRSESYTVDNPDRLTLLPESIRVPEAVMLCNIVPSGIAAAESVDVLPGDTVIVEGNDAAALCCVAACALKNALQIIMVTSSKCLQEKALGYGADKILSSYKVPDNIQADKVCICSGNTRYGFVMLQSLKEGGGISIANPSVDNSGMDLSRLYDDGRDTGKRIVFIFPDSQVYTTRISGYVRLVQMGRLDLKPLVMGVYNGWDELPPAIEAESEGLRAVVIL